MASTPSTHGEGAGRIWKHSLDRPADSPCVLVVLSLWGGGGLTDRNYVVSMSSGRMNTVQQQKMYLSVMRQNCCKTDHVEFWKILLYFYSRNYTSYIENIV